MPNSIMTHIVAGYPTLKESKKIADCMLNNGVSFLEIQIPFSDPVADGKTILKANRLALENGIKVEDSFRLMNSLSNKSKTPLLFMTYFNILFNYGVEKFIKKAKKSGSWGLIVPDIPINEENEEHYIKLCRKYGIHPIQVISPITPEKRLKILAKVASGFVYCVSGTGVTGERRELSAELSSYIKKIKKYFKIPIAVGFGISEKKHVEEVLKHADIAVIGSKIINLYDDFGIKKIERFLKDII